MATFDLGTVTAYAYAVAGGYTGTEAEFEELLGNIADDLSQIENLSVTVETLPAGSSATASYSDGVLSLGIPKGDKGDQGIQGIQGLTGNGIASIEETSVSGAVHTYTITYTNGQTTTFDVTDGEVTTASLTATLADYARIDGYYEDLTAGYAENLISNVFEEDSVPYNFRTAGGSLDIGSFENDTVVGGSLAVNQLVNTGSTSVTVQNGHKYFSNINNVKTIGASTGSAISINDASKDNVIDLTLLFGTTIADYIYTLETGQAGAGVAWFKKLFPKSYYPYNAGELMHVQTSGHKTVGFNQWDEEWRNGYYSADGTFYSTPAGYTNLANTNPVKVIPNTTYYIKAPANNSNTLIWLDADLNVISANTNATFNTTVTSPSNAHYMNFKSNYVGATSATYKNDICINLHWDGERDGEYEAYSEHTYPLDSSLTLRGIPKLDSGNNLYYDGDIYEADGTVTRKYGIKTFDGSENWIKSGSYTNSYYLQNAFTDAKMFGTNHTTDRYTKPCANITDYSATDYASYIENSMTLNLKLGTNATLNDFKTNLQNNPITIVYELNSPTTETADPFQNPQAVSNWGTEEYIDERTIAIPVGHNTEYPADLKAKVETSPNPPDADGDYLVRHVNGENVYISLASNATITDILNRLSALEG